MNNQRRSEAGKLSARALRERGRIAAEAVLALEIEDLDTFLARRGVLEAIEQRRCPRFADVRQLEEAAGMEPGL